MARLLIQGGRPLSGVITPSGNKNAALPLLAACLLTDERMVLHNLPNIRDVWSMIHILQRLGVEVQELPATATSQGTVDPAVVPPTGGIARGRPDDIRSNPLVLEAYLGRMEATA
mgnify:CR=1 FL=1